MAKRKKEKEKKSVYIVTIVAAVAIVFLLSIFNSPETKQGPMMGISGRVVEPLDKSNVIEKKDAPETLAKLDECLQYCQYDICKKNCELGESVQPECFRVCVDECNNKCLEIYGW